MTLASHFHIRAYYLLRDRRGVIIIISKGIIIFFFFKEKNGIWPSRGKGEEEEAEIDTLLEDSRSVGRSVSLVTV